MQRSSALTLQNERNDPAQREQQKLKVEHYGHQLNLARQEAILEDTRLASEFESKGNQLAHAKQKFESGLIDKRKLEQLEHEVEMAKLHFEQNQLQAKRHLRDLEMQLRQEGLLLKQMESTQEPKF